MAQGIEELAEIIKDYARKYRKFNERLSDLEVKIFGQARDEKKKGKTNAGTKAIGKENNSSQLNGSKVRDRSPAITSKVRKDHSPPVQDNAIKKGQGKKQKNRSKSKQKD